MQELRLDRNLAEDVLRAAVKTGGDFAELFMEDRLDNNLTLRGGLLEHVSSGRKSGAGIRVLSGTRQIYVYTNDLSAQGLLRCAREAAAAVSAQADCRPIPLKSTSFSRPEEILLPPSSVKAALKAEKLRAADAAARSVSPEITQVVCGYGDVEQSVLVANTEGTFATDLRVRTRLTCQAVAGSGSENQVGFDGPGAGMGFELFDNRVDPVQVGKNAANTAVTMLHAPLCPAGKMPVVIGNGFGGVLFHEACGHSLEATSVGPGYSEFSGKLGQRIAANCVTAVDDGTIPLAWGSLHMDDEGMPTTNLTLIENGVLTHYMIDILGERRLNLPRTGSGRRQGYAFAPTSRMRNTYIAAGQDDEKEMIATMGDGLYAAKMGGGSVNPTTGEFNFSVMEGWLVKDGRLDTPVRGASLIGRGSEVLLKIDRVGRNLSHGEGMCGSISGSIPTCVGQPSIRISSLTVGGGK